MVKVGRCELEMGKCKRSESEYQSRIIAARELACDTREMASVL